MELVGQVEAELAAQDVVDSQFWVEQGLSLTDMILYGIEVCGEYASVTGIADFVVERFDLYVRGVTEP